MGLTVFTNLPTLPFPHHDASHPGLSLSLSFSLSLSLPFFVFSTKTLPTLFSSFSPLLSSLLFSFFLPFFFLSLWQPCLSLFNFLNAANVVTVLSCELCDFSLYVAIDLTYVDAHPFPSLYDPVALRRGQELTARANKFFPSLASSHLLPFCSTPASSYSTLPFLSSDKGNDPYPGLSPRFSHRRGRVWLINYPLIVRKREARALAESIRERMKRRNKAKTGSDEAEGKCALSGYVELKKRGNGKRRRIYMVDRKI